MPYDCDTFIVKIAYSKNMIFYLFIYLCYKLTECFYFVTDMIKIQYCFNILTQNRAYHKIKVKRTNL